MFRETSIRPKKHPGKDEFLRIATVALPRWEVGQANARLIAAAPDLLRELQAANQIIRNALAVMTNEQDLKWGRLNNLDNVSGDTVTRVNERESVIAKAGGAT